MAPLRAIASLALLLALASVVRADAPAALARQEFVAPHMGTLFRIVLYAPEAEAAAARTAVQAAFARVAALNRVFSDYDDSSELSHLCRQPVGTPVPVSADLFAILTQSQLLSAQTHGAFDVTLSPVTRLWRESRRTRHLPAPEILARARQASGHAHLRLDPATQTATLLRPEMQFDLGGIAKGYAADTALAVLTHAGFPRAMVNASGDLALGEPPPDEPGWTITLAPFGASPTAPLTLVAARVGISTSGDAGQFAEIGGVRYSHIVDPATGLGLTAPLAVTVIAPRASLSDGLATACSVLSAEAVNTLATTSPEPIRVIVHRRAEDGSIQRMFSGQNPAGLLNPL